MLLPLYFLFLEEKGKKKNRNLFFFFTLQVYLLSCNKTITVYEDTKSSTNILISRRRVAGIETKGILGSSWFGGNFLTECIDHLLILIPHLLIFSIKGLAKLRAKRNEHSPLMDLPRDIILDVLTRLPVKSLSEMRCISKTSLNIIDNPFFATLHTSPTLHTPRLLNSFGTNYVAAVEVPQLMLLAQSWSSRAKRSTTLQSLKYSGEHGLTKSKHWHAKILSEFGNYQVDFVFCNLVCFKHEIRTFGLLLNPLRGQVLELPKNHLLLSS
ncbi:unnamed protein product [Prunus brigantina]